jgi:hypothetical protein
MAAAIPTADPFGQHACPKVCPSGRPRSAIVRAVQDHLVEPEVAAHARAAVRPDTTGRQADLRFPAGNAAAGTMLAQRSSCGAGCGCATCGATPEEAPAQRLSAGSLLALQRTAGNESVELLLKGMGRAG